MNQIIEKMKTKKMISYLAIVLIFVIGFILFRYTDFPFGKKSGTEDTAAVPVTVQVQKAETLSILPTSTFDATLLAGEKGVVGADVPGKVLQILFNEGDIVKKGTPLIILDSRDMNDQLKAAQAQLDAVQASIPKAKANVDISKRNFNNAKELLEVGAASPNDVSDAETALKIAEADLNALTSNIAAAQSGVDRLKHNLDNMVIKAPIAGVIEDKNVAIGAYVAPGVPLAMVKNNATLEAVFKIPQEDANLVKVGQKAKVKVSGDNQVYDGIVTYFSTEASIASRTLMSKVELSNTNNRLKAGIFASVDIVSGEETSVLAIPLEAVAGSEGSYYVFVAENGVARQTEVSLGETYQDLIIIKSGLQEGARVICSNINVLQDGDLITVATEQGE